MDLKDEATANKLTNATTSAVVAVVITVLLQFGIIGPTRESQLLDHQKTIYEIKQQLASVDHKIDIYIATTEIRTADRWSSRDMTLWVARLETLNPGLTIPTLEEARIP